MTGSTDQRVRCDGSPARAEGQRRQPHAERDLSAPTPWVELQAIAGNRAVAALVASGRGQSAGDPLEASTRTEMESLFDWDFGEVRVHADESAARSTVAEHARAYTVGRDIVFGPGRYAPHTGEGRRLLAHELAHVVQQSRPARASDTCGCEAVGPAGAEAEACQAAADVAGGRRPSVQAAARGIQRDELTDEELRRLATTSCPSGGCHEPVGGPGIAPKSPHIDPATLRSWLQQPRPSAPRPLPVLHPPTEHQAPPGIARLAPQRKRVQVVEFFVPEARIASPVGALGSTRALSQAVVAREYGIEIDRPDPTAGYTFDTYLSNITTGRRIAAQHLGGTRYRVLMGTPECPGCHFGAGLVVDLKGQSFIEATAESLVNAITLAELVTGMSSPPRLPGGTASEEAALAARPPGPEGEFEDFLTMLREEGATEFEAAGEPVTLHPHGTAAEAKRMLGASSQTQSMHGLPRSVGKHLPGYDPKAALTTLGERAMHTELDQPWKDAFQAMRREGRTTASAREVYDELATSIDRSSQLPPGTKETLKHRLRDEMFVEYGLAPNQELPLPYPNVKPRHVKPRP